MLFSSCDKFKRDTSKKKLYYVFWDLENSFDRIPREVVFEKAGCGWVVHTHSYGIVSEACTVVIADAGLSERFEVKVAFHQGSVLSPLLFFVVSSEARSGLFS